jgi:o-succinylbenzoate synthase
MVRIEVKKHRLLFRFKAKTSRGIMEFHDIAYLKLFDVKNNLVGIGEIAPIPNLSKETLDESLYLLNKLPIEKFDDLQSLQEWIANQNFLPSSLVFGLETAIGDIYNGGYFQPFVKNNDLSPIKINGLIWMNNLENMIDDVVKKVNEGFTCIKFKVGSLKIDEEEKLLEVIREKYPNLIIKVDANGAWSLKQALHILHQWEKYHIHSVEQPIYTQNWNELKLLCDESPIHVAFDEQLIKKYSEDQKYELLEYTNPKYLVLKPGLIGGFAETKEWIKIANSLNIKWWITSALESNIGLNAIYRFTVMLNNTEQIHGLGTGNLYSNNWNSPLEVKNGSLVYNQQKSWMGEI